MMPSRALPLALVLAIVPLWPAAAQFGGMPGMPGSPGMGAPGMSPFGAPQPQQGPPPACQQLLVLRDETQKHGAALQAAGQRKEKAQPDEVCKLFKTFLASEAKMLKGLKDNASTCGVPPEVLKNVTAAHGKATEMGKNICDAAAQGPRPSGPSLSEALGSTPTVPDSNSAKKGGGTFDTLQGTPLQR